MTARWRVFATAALVAILLAILVYVCFVLTTGGQQADDVAFDGRVTEPEQVRRDANDVLSLITRASLALVGGAIVLLALERRRWRLAVGAAVVIGGAVLTAEVLKAVLPRPTLLEVDEIGFNSWPSGHVSIATSVGLAAVMVVPYRWRGPTALLAALFAGTFAMAVVVSGWHRPSDALGGVLNGFAWACAVSAVLLWWRGAAATPHDPAEEEGRGLVGWAALALAAGFVGLVTVVLVGRGDEILVVNAHAALLVSLAGLAAAAFVSVGVYLWLLRGVALDPRPATAVPGLGALATS